MSYLKFSDNLFLGKQELSRFKQYLDDTGFRRFFSLSVSNYGVVQNATGSFTNFQTQIGTNTNSIKVLAGYAIDSAINLITFPTTDNIPVPADSNWYWVKISFAYSANEQGTFSVDTAGNLTGVNSNLTAVLRGIPNNPSKIKFPNATLNTGEYFVNTITNDSSATLSGTFVNESNLTLSVVGSFTPDAVPLSGDKQIFQYDSCSMSLVLETVSNTPPTLISGKEFVIARVQNTGVGYNIQDKRSLNLFNGAGGGGLFLPLSGGNLSGNLDMGGNHIINLPQANASGQPVTYEQLSPLKTKVVNIGDWNMNSSASGTQTVNVPHGLGTYTGIRSIRTMIIQNTGQMYPLERANLAFNGTIDGWVVGMNATNIVLFARLAGSFDSIQFDSLSFNRGYVTIDYI